MKNEEMILQLLAELKAGQDELRAGQDELRAGQDELRAGQDALSARLEKVEARQEALEAEMRHTRVLVEQQDHKISLVAEQYGDVAAKLDTLLHKAAQVDELRSRTSTLETVVAEFTAMGPGVISAMVTRLVNSAMVSQPWASTTCA